MPPKKRIVKATRRTPRSTAKSKSQTPATPPPDIEPASPPSSSAAALPDLDSTPCAAVAAEAATTPVAAPEVDAPAVEPIAAPEAVEAETAVAESMEAEAEPKPSEEEPPAVAADEAEKPAEEPPAVAADETVKPAEEPSAAEGQATPKTTTRVRKVIKKKIIVKKVPKGTLAAATATAKEENKPQESVEQNPNPNSQPEPESKPECIPELEFQKPSSDAATSEVARPTELEAVPEQEKHEEALEAAQMVEERVEVKEAVVAPMEVDKVEQKEEVMIPAGVGDEEKGISERRRRRKTEIFIGGLDRDAKEEDIRKVFGTIGEIVEVRMMMDNQTGKNKGYAFLRYAEAAQAKKAVKEFVKVEVCGKLCGAAALEGNDTIFLGNIDKKWKKEDVIKLLEEIGIEKIDTVTVMADPGNADLNRGFAFLELETNRDAQVAYKKLQKKDVFGKGRNIKVAWAEPLNDPDEEEMQKVKSVYAEGIPSSWDEKKLREIFKKFGDIERVVLSRNIKSAKRKDFAFINYTTREAALSCVESFEKEELTDNGLKVNVKVSLAKPVQKGKQNKGASKSSNKDSVKDKPKAVQRDTRASIPASKGNSFKGANNINGGDKSSTNRELLHVLREQATWKQGQISYARGPAAQDYPYPLHGGKRTSSSLGDDSLYSDLRGYPRARLDSSYPVAGSSYDPMSHGMAGSSLPYYQRPSAGYQTGELYGSADRSSTHQTRQGTAPYGSGYYSRY